MNLNLVRPENLWYVVGLITTDGNLSSDGRHINITSKDRILLQKIKRALYLTNKIGRKTRGYDTEKKYSVLAFGDVTFYRYLVGIGLSPRKSLTLDSLQIPREYFPDFLRGVIDGDGSISMWIHKNNQHIQWCLRVTSAAPLFSNWLKKEIESYFSVYGKIYQYHFKNKKNPINILKFGKIATKIILTKTYYPNCLALDRKLHQAMKCIVSSEGWGKYGAMKLSARVT